MDTKSEMNDEEVMSLRNEHVTWMETLAAAKETRDEAETHLMAAPNSLLIRFVVWMMNWVVKQSEYGEEAARRDARRTYDV